MVRVSIIGVTGYTGSKLLEILLKHPEAEIAYLASRTHNGKYVHEVIPNLKNRIYMKLIDYDFKKISTSDCVFSCLPAGELNKIINSINTFVIDLSPDFRFRNTKIYKSVYGFEHQNKKLIEKFIYSIPEINAQKIKKSSGISNPGCYAISIILGIYPIKNYIEELFISASSGVSGAGKKLLEQYLFSELDENYYPYSLPVHRHTYEVEEFTGIKPKLITHLLPLKQGILSTMFVKLKKTIDVNEALKSFYKNKNFVRVLDTPPMIKNVINTNFVDIYAINIDKKTSYIFSAIDNLYKGASGNAVQSMNIKFGFSETIGLF